MGLFPPKKNSKATGEYSEAVIAARLLEQGYNVLKPYGDNTRYDIVIEDADGNFWRVQCKTGWLVEEEAVIEFNTASSYAHTRKGQKAGFGRRGYAGQVEFFAVYCPDTRGVYLIPVDHVGSTHARLRLVPTGNRQQKGVRMAADYEI